jgi:AMP nucleosidase
MTDFPYMHELFTRNQADFLSKGTKVADELIDQMSAIYQSGFYPKVTVHRNWSEHNPNIGGEFAWPEIYRWYLRREFSKLLEKGATIEVTQSRQTLALNDPQLLENLDESEWDYTKKKLFFFQPERMEISIDRLHHYTATEPKYFQRYIVFTNYQMHVEVFLEKYSNCIQPSRDGAQMPAYHHVMPDNSGITLVNIGVGPSNAKTITDHVAILRPDAMIMVGHCGGLRNHQEIGDFVLASGYFRDDHVLDDFIPDKVPIAPNFQVNQILVQILERNALNYRIGTVFTTANRNWELSLGITRKLLHESRSIAIDMESATVATNGFRYRVPNATLLCVSDKPLHGKPKLSQAAQSFYNNSKQMHLQLIIDTLEVVKEHFPDGLPNDSIRSFDEPMMG